jgi:hypothetical protein
VAGVLLSARVSQGSFHHETRRKILILAMGEGVTELALVLLILFVFRCQWNCWWQLSFLSSCHPVLSFFSQFSMIENEKGLAERIPQSMDNLIS